jgi:hypothetical protein
LQEGGQGKLGWRGVGSVFVKWAVPHSVRGLTCVRPVEQMRTVLYGKKAANLYTQAFVQNTQARALYQESEDTYYRANDAASYDDWRRARHQWDYFYNRH